MNPKVIIIIIIIFTTPVTIGPLGWAVLGLFTLSTGGKVIDSVTANGPLQGDSIKLICNDSDMFNPNKCNPYVNETFDSAEKDGVELKALISPQITRKESNCRKLQFRDTEGRAISGIVCDKKVVTIKPQVQSVQLSFFKSGYSDDPVYTNHHTVTLDKKSFALNQSGQLEFSLDPILQANWDTVRIDSVVPTRWEN